jgi:hypothetical protein
VRAGRQAARGGESGLSQSDSRDAACTSG